MTLEELKTALSELDVPVYYARSAQGQVLPYIVYEISYSHNFVADGNVYHKINHIDLSLYTKTKDQELEEDLEDILDDEGLVYEKTEEYLTDSKVYQIIYEMEI